MICCNLLLKVHCLTVIKCSIEDLPQITAEALVSGHTRGVKKVSVAGAGHLRECENTEFVWEFNHWGFGLMAVSKAFRLRGYPLRELRLYWQKHKSTLPPWKNLHLPLYVFQLFLTKYKRASVICMRAIPVNLNNTLFGLNSTPLILQLA